MNDNSEESMTAIEEEADDQGYWPQDRGGLEFDARRTLLQLIRGPMITAENNSELWRALLNHRQSIEVRLADMFLELVIDHDAGIAFVRNAVSEQTELPKAVRSQPLTLIDTVMVLNLRKELLIGYPERVFIGREELFEQLSHYRPVVKLDEAAYRKRLDTSWSRLSKAGLLQDTDTEDRYEISPVLKLIFGADEVRAINAEFDLLLKETPPDDGEFTDTPPDSDEDTEGN